MSIFIEQIQPNVYLVTVIGGNPNGMAGFGSIPVPCSKEILPSKLTQLGYSLGEIQWIVAQLRQRTVVIPRRARRRHLPGKRRAENLP